LEADNITLSGFTIDGDSSTDVGIYFDNYSFINIKDNLIKNNKDYGISYINSAPVIEGNNIENNSSSGIKVATNGVGIIRNNSIVSNQHGIRTYGDSSPEITRNNISNNNTGIYCRESAAPIISYNTIGNNSGYGILIDNALGNLVNPDIGGGDGKSDGYNKIIGNSTHGVSNETTHNIMAKNNWWGDAAGPKYPYHTSSSGDWAYWNGAGSEIIFTPHLTIEP
jgi:parallel beta-helix repeat protein